MTARRRLITAVGTLAAALACTGTPAHAAPGQASMFMDDDLLLFHGDEMSDRTLQELKALGVDWIRVSVPWRGFAPGATSAKKPSGLTDATSPAQYPATNFDLHDHVVRVANRLGIKVLFNVTGDAPLWATGRLAGRTVSARYKPSATEFGKFVRMLGTRYDGRHADENQGQATLPRVDAWSIWNEPNAGANLEPQWERSRRTGRLVPASPRIYRGLARAAIASLKASGHGGDTILLGETAPRGLDSKGRTRSMRPVTFLDALFCLDARGRSLRGRAAADLGCDFGKAGRLAVTGYAHHPYSIVSAPDVADRNAADITLADAPRLARILDAAGARGRIPAGLKYWWTEYGWQTNPPDPTSRGVPLADQARWIAQAEKITREDPRAAALTQFLLRDDQPRDEPGASTERRWSTYQTGLQTADGTAKPGLDAYRLPLVASAAKVGPGGALSLWGFVRPSTGAQQPNVQLQFAPAGSTDFQPVGGAIAIDGGTRIFTTQVTPERSGVYRFTWAPSTAAPAPQPTGLDALLGRKPAAPQASSFSSAPVSVTVG